MLLLVSGVLCLLPVIPQFEIFAESQRSLTFRTMCTESLIPAYTLSYRDELFLAIECVQMSACVDFLRSLHIPANLSDLLSGQFITNNPKYVAKLWRVIFNFSAFDDQDLRRVRSFIVKYAPESKLEVDLPPIGEFSADIAQ